MKHLRCAIGAIEANAVVADPGRRRLAAAALGAAALSLARPLRAQSAWPSRPLRIVAPFPPGGGADTVARAVAGELERRLQQSVIVDNRPGAAGNLGAEVVATATDGHTMLWSVNSIVAINPLLYRGLKFDAARDLRPLAQVATGSYLLLVNAASPWRTLADFVAAAKAAPGRLNYASFGSGSGPHLAMELLKSRAGIFVTHIPYRGAAPALTDLIGGQVQALFDTSISALPHLRSGRLRALASGGPKRVDALPGLPTVAETYPGFDTDGWQGVFVPSAMPQPAQAALRDALVESLGEPALRKRIRDLGFEPSTLHGPAFESALSAERERWAQVIRERGIVLD